MRDYRSLERAFGGQLPITSLRVSIEESTFVGLIKIMDFFRYSGVQRLKELFLPLVWLENASRISSCLGLIGGPRRNDEAHVTMLT